MIPTILALGVFMSLTIYSFVMWRIEHKKRIDDQERRIMSQYSATIDIGTIDGSWVAAETALPKFDEWKIARVEQLSVASNGKWYKAVAESNNGAVILGYGDTPQLALTALAESLLQS